MSGKTSDAMVQGMFMGASLLRSLVEKVVALGGFPEQIHYLTTKRGQETLDELAEIIVKSSWKIPASLMQRLAFQNSLEEWGIEDAERDKYFFWASLELEKNFGIPTRRFGDFDSEEAEGDIPLEVTRQLSSMKVVPRKPIVVIIDEEEYVVVSIDEDQVLVPGESYPPLDKVVRHDWIRVASAKYFDLTR